MSPRDALEFWGLCRKRQTSFLRLRLLSHERFTAQSLDLMAALLLSAMSARKEWPLHSWAYMPTSFSWLSTLNSRIVSSMIDRSPSLISQQYEELTGRLPQLQTLITEAMGRCGVSLSHTHTNTKFNVGSFYYCCVIVYFFSNFLNVLIFF